MSIVCQSRVDEDRQQHARQGEMSVNEIPSPTTTEPGKAAFTKLTEHQAPQHVLDDECEKPIHPRRNLTHIALQI